MEKKILAAIADKKKYRDDIAELYAGLIYEMRDNPMKNVSKVNRAIINRWSLSGLEYIKNKAWKWVETLAFALHKKSV